MGESVSYDAIVLPKNLGTSENKQGDDWTGYKQEKSVARLFKHIFFGLKQKFST